MLIGIESQGYIMVVNSQKEQLAANDNNGEDSSGSKQKAVKGPWTGHYRLNFSIRPRSPEIGWRVGDRAFRDAYGSPEILLRQTKDHHDV